MYIHKNTGQYSDQFVYADDSHFCVSWLQSDNYYIPYDLTRLTRFENFALEIAPCWNLTTWMYDYMLEIHKPIGAK